MPRPDENRMPEHQMRLQRFLAAAGLGSRRACEALVESGRVTIDGTEVTELGTRVFPESQQVKLDGQILTLQKQRFFLVNKPAGCVCTNRDPDGRPLAIDLVPLKNAPRLFTVGRLDETSEGLLLITNDGNLAHRLMHPRFRVIRTYRLQVAGVPQPETIRQLKQGLYFSDGRFRVRNARRLKSQGRSSFLEVEMTEGKNREIRRLFARVGHKVMRLTRVAFGPLKLGTLLPGRCRELTKAEVEDLKAFALSPLQRTAQRGSSRKGKRYSEQTTARGGKSRTKKSANNRNQRPNRGRGRQR